MKQVLNITVQLVLTAMVVWAAAMVMSYSNMFISQEISYRSIASEGK